MDIKGKGQVFTPEWVVCELLDVVGYWGADILRRHVMDNSCGKGAILIEVVRRYCYAWKRDADKTRDLKRELENYIHGIEIDKECYEACINKLDAVAKGYGVTGVKWNILHADAFSCVEKFERKMDYVIGNPPYVRIHNISEKVRECIAKLKYTCGITDLYLAFMELGFRMLSHKGKMSLITPSFWMMSTGGDKLRRFIYERGWLRKVINMSDVRVFPGVNTKTAISVFDSSDDIKEVEFYMQNSDKEGDFYSIGSMPYATCFIKGKIFFDTRYNIGRFRNALLYDGRKYVRVKNAFATLADSLFIGENIPSSKFNIRVVKSSTGKWTQCFFPYDKNGIVLSEDRIKEDSSVWEYLLENKDSLLKRKSDSDVFYAFGRSQGVKDVFKEKISINCLIKDTTDIKMEIAPAGTGVYSGLYLLIEDENLNIQNVKNVLYNEDFLQYLRFLGKFKSGGYMTFSSIELENYINYEIDEKIWSKISV